MRKRDRLLRLLKRASSNNPPNRETVSPPVQPSPSPEPTPPPSTEVEPDVQLAPAADANDGSTDSAMPEPTEEPTEEQTDEQAAKIARHFEKTRVAMLKFLVKEGGSSHLKEMHDLSERRYFIAHRRFSDLMESLVDEKLIDFDQQRNEATISASGREYIQE